MVLSNIDMSKARDELIDKYRLEISAIDRINKTIEEVKNSIELFNETGIDKAILSFDFEKFNLIKVKECECSHGLFGDLEAQIDKSFTEEIKRTKINSCDLSPEDLVERYVTTKEEIYEKINNSDFSLLISSYMTAYNELAEHAEISEVSKKKVNENESFMCIINMRPNIETSDAHFQQAGIYAVAVVSLKEDGTVLHDDYAERRIIQNINSGINSYAEENGYEAIVQSLTDVITNLREAGFNLLGDICQEKAQRIAILDTPNASIQQEISPIQITLN